MSKIRPVLGVLAPLVLAAVAYFGQDYLESPTEFRGILRTHLVAPGGETTGVGIVTSKGCFEIDLHGMLEPSVSIELLDRRPVVVYGRLRRGQSIEGQPRRIIRVHRILVEDLVTAPSVE